MPDKLFCELQLLLLLTDLTAPLLLQWLEHRGRSWGDNITLAQAGISSFTPVTVHLRLRGGGGDGGSTGAESRSSYLEMYAKKKADKVSFAMESRTEPACLDYCWPCSIQLL